MYYVCDDWVEFCVTLHTKPLCNVHYIHHFKSLKSLGLEIAKNLKSRSVAEIIGNIAGNGIGLEKPPINDAELNLMYAIYGGEGIRYRDFIGKGMIPRVDIVDGAFTTAGFYDFIPAHAEYPEFDFNNISCMKCEDVPKFLIFIKSLYGTALRTGKNSAYQATVGWSNYLKRQKNFTFC